MKTPLTKLELKLLIFRSGIKSKIETTKHANPKFTHYLACKVTETKQQRILYIFMEFKRSEILSQKLDLAYDTNQSIQLTKSM